MNRLEAARRVIRLEAEAVAGLESVLDDRFEQAVELMLACSGRVVCTGMGKAGHIARKIAATLASTGTPAFFMNPAEGVHGDLGMISSDDVVLALSNAGQTDELLRVLPYVSHVGAKLVAVTGNSGSDLARQADVALVYAVREEACPLNLAPTSSTTAMLVLGDALALVLLEARGFGPEDYAMRHPGGSLGRRLLTKVGDLMHTGADNPVVGSATPLYEAVVVMTRCKVAATSVTDPSGRLVGFFTDGDLRRSLMDGEVDLNEPIERLMTRDPKRVTPTTMAVKALEVLREHKIIQLPVVNDAGEPVGIVHLHDIERAGIS